MPAELMQNRIQIILQARVDSSRLWGKALLPLGGMPAAVLACRRAARGGRPVTLATSDRAIDDALADAARDHGISVFRGNAYNVLGRYLDATRDLSNDAVIVRLTGDNVLPDADFVELMLRTFEESGAPYLGTD